MSRLEQDELLSEIFNHMEDLLFKNCQELQMMDKYRARVDLQLYLDQLKRQGAIDENMITYCYDSYGEPNLVNIYIQLPGYRAIYHTFNLRDYNKKELRKRKIRNIK